jgi:hypothetical protein
VQEYHALVSVRAVDVEQADAFFERIGRDATRYGGKLAVIPSASAMEDPRMTRVSYEPHPRLEVVAGDLMRSTRPGETRAGGPAPGDHDYVRHRGDYCECCDPDVDFCQNRRGV